MTLPRLYRYRRLARLGPVTLAFDARDVWVGVRRAPVRTDRYNAPRSIVVRWYVCLVPCLVVSWERVRVDPYYDCSDWGRHRGPWSHVKGTDSVEVCEACGQQCGK